MNLKVKLLIGLISIIFIIVGSIVQEYYDKEDFFSYSRLYNENDFDSYVYKISRHDGYEKGYFILELLNKKKFLIDYKLENRLEVGSGLIKFPGENRIKIINDGKFEYFEFKEKY